MKFKHMMFIGLLLMALLIIPISFAADADLGGSASSLMIDDGDSNFDLDYNLKYSKNSLKSIGDDRLIGNYSNDESDSSSSISDSSDSFSDSSSSISDFSDSFSDSSSSISDFSDSFSDSSSIDTYSINSKESEIKSLTKSLNDLNSNVKYLNYSEYDDYINLNNLLVDYDFNITNNNTIFVNASYAGSIENGNQSTPFKTITAAYNQFITSSNKKTNIFLADGVYKLTRRMTITKNLNIIGESTLNTIIDGLDTYQMFYISPASSYNVVSPLVNVFNLTFTRASANYGGAFYINESAVNFVKTIFKSNKAIDRTSYSSTYPASGGAIYNDKGFVRIYNSLFVNNTVNGTYDTYAGAIFNDMGEMTILSSQIINNTVVGEYSSGGALYDYSGILVLFNSTISGNKLISNYSMGGGLCNWASHNVFIINSTIDSNEIYGDFTFGSAIANKAILLDLVNSTISNNFANGTSDANGTIFHLNGIINFTSTNFTANRVSNTRDDLFLCLEDQLIVSNAFDDDDELTELPSKYDLREEGLVTPVKDQGGSGSCWAFSTLAALESFLLKTEGLAYDFSENNMKNLMGYYGLNGTDWGDGGNHFMSLSYLLRWTGPVDESLDPFSDTNHNSITFTNISRHVQDVLYIPIRLNYQDTNQIKKALMTYGALYTTMHADDSFQYNTNYYHDVIAVSNHAITLVGWDDNYSADNFAVKPPGDGAYIIKNSWGTNYGDDGFWYISYYDKTFAGYGLDTLSAIAFTNVENVSGYKNIYQYDILGNTFESIGFNSNTAWMANQFTAINHNPIAAVGFYTFGTSDYLINITVNGISKIVQEGNVSGAGYHTVKLDNWVELVKDDVFKVIVKLTTPDSLYPIAIESCRESYSSGASSNPGESFISIDGETWHDLYDYNEVIKFYQDMEYHILDEANVCLKAYSFGESDIFLDVKSNVSAYIKGDYVEVKVHIYNEGENAEDVNVKIDLPKNVSIRGNQYTKGTFNSNTKVWHLDSLNENEHLTLTLKLLMNINEPIAELSFDFNFSGHVPSTLNTSRVLYLYYGDVSQFIQLENISTYVNSNEPVSIRLVDLESNGIEDKEIVLSLIDCDNDCIFENMTSVTDSNGTSIFNLNLLEGNYTFLASFDGDADYKSSNMTFNVSAFKVSSLIEAIDDLSNLTVFAHSNDTISFSLSDEFLNGIADKEIIVSLADSSESDDLINENGIVDLLTTDENGTVYFNLDLTEGIYSFAVSFLGDEIYKPSNMTFDVNIIRINTILDLDSSNLILSNETDLISLTKSGDIIEFKLYEEFIDGINQAIPMANRTISLIISDLEGNMESHNLITDSEGITSFAIDLSEGVYEFVADYIGDENYYNKSISFNLSVIKRNAPHIIVDDVTINGSDSYQVHLLDDEFNPVANYPINFNLVSLDDEDTSINISLSTNDKGIAILNGLSNLNSGNYTLSISLDSNELYNGAILVTNITIFNEPSDNGTDDNGTDDNLSQKINTFISIDITDLNFYANLNQTVEFRLLDENMTALAQKTIGLVILNNNLSYELITDSNGLAPFVFNLNEGKYEVILNYAGDESYGESSLLFNVEVFKRNSKLLPGNDQINNSDEYYVCLIGDNLKFLANETVSFVVFSYETHDAVLNYTAVTDDLGIAYLKGLSNLEEGKYLVNATFNSNPIYNDANLLKNITIKRDSSDDNGTDNRTVVRKATYILYEDMVTESVITAVDGRIGEYFHVKLVDENKNPLAGLPIKIGFNGKIYNRTTDENGSAKLQINLKTPVIYTFAICFLGDDDYNASFEVAKITVNKKKMSLTVPNKSYKSTAKTKTLTATLMTSKGKVVANKVISFTVNGKTYSAKTNSKGVASVKVSLSSKKTYSFTAKFAGDECYGAVTKSAKLTIK